MKILIFIFRRWIAQGTLACLMAGIPAGAYAYEDGELFLSINDYVLQAKGHIDNIGVALQEHLPPGEDILMILRNQTGSQMGNDQKFLGGDFQK